MTTRVVDGGVRVVDVESVVAHLDGKMRGFREKVVVVLGG